MKTTLSRNTAQIKSESPRSRSNRQHLGDTRKQIPTNEFHGLTNRKAWKELVAHFSQVQAVHLRELFAANPKRAEQMSLEAVGLHLDYSKNRVTEETLR